MSLGYPGHTRNETATSSSIDQWNLVKDNGSGLVQETTAVGDTPYGVAMQSADADEDLTVKVSGVTKAEVDGSGTAINKGDFLMPDGTTDGRLIAHSGTTGDTYAAKALESSSAAGDVIDVLLLGGEYPEP